MDPSVLQSEEQRFWKAWKTFSQLVTIPKKRSTRKAFVRMLSLRKAPPSQEPSDVCWGHSGYKEDPPKWFDELRNLIIWVIGEMMMFTEHEKVLATRIAEFIFMYIDERADPTMYDDVGQDYPSEENLEAACLSAVEASEGLDMSTIVEKVSSVIIPWIADDIYYKYIDDAMNRLIREAWEHGYEEDYEEDADEDVYEEDVYEEDYEEDVYEEDCGMSMDDVKATSFGG